jgi:hypothetical protein
LENTRRADKEYHTMRINLLFWGAVIVAVAAAVLYGIQLGAL